MKKLRLCKSFIYLTLLFFPLVIHAAVLTKPVTLSIKISDDYLKSLNWNPAVISMIGTISTSTAGVTFSMATSNQGMAGEYCAWAASNSAVPFYTSGSNAKGVYSKTTENGRVFHNWKYTNYFQYLTSGTTSYSWAPQVVNINGTNDCTTYYLYSSGNATRYLNLLSGNIGAFSMASDGTISGTTAVTLDYDTTIPLPTVSKTTLNYTQDATVTQNLIAEAGISISAANKLKYNQLIYASDPNIANGVCWKMNLYQTNFYPYTNTSTPGTMIYYVTYQNKTTGTESYPVKITVNVNPQTNMDNIVWQRLYMHTYEVAATGVAYGNYKQQISGWPSDGSYMIINKLDGASGLPGDWNWNFRDHTTGNTNMYIVNADATANGLFYSQVLSVCIGTKMKFSAWFQNICNGTTSPYRIKPNIRFRIQQSNSPTGPWSNLTIGYTGEIEMNRKWQKESITFTPYQPYLQLVFENINIGGAGNDFAIDDVTIERAQGDVKITTTSPICNMNSDLILNTSFNKTQLINDLGLPQGSTQAYYRWAYRPYNQPMQFITNILTADLSNPDAFNLLLTYNNENAQNMVKQGFYYLYVENSEAALNQNISMVDLCAIKSIYELTPYQLYLDPGTVTAAKTAVCQGSPVTLKAGVNVIGDITWYQLTTQGVRIPLGKGNQITVTPTVTTTYGITVDDCSSSSAQVTVNVKTAPCFNLGN